MDHHHPQSRINLDHLYERYDLADYLKQQKEVSYRLVIIQITIFLYTKIDRKFFIGRFR